jgi:hypothetical protein
MLAPLIVVAHCVATDHNTAAAGRIPHVSIP